MSDRDTRVPLAAVVNNLPLLVEALNGPPKVIARLFVVAAVTVHLLFEVDIRVPFPEEHP